MKLTKEERMMFSTRWRGTGPSDMITTATSALPHESHCVLQLQPATQLRTAKGRPGRHSQDNDKPRPSPDKQHTTQQQKSKSTAQKKARKQGYYLKKERSTKAKIETLKQD
jgi:hypothetical protein